MAKEQHEGTATERRLTILERRFMLNFLHWKRFASLAFPRPYYTSILLLPLPWGYRVSPVASVTPGIRTNAQRSDVWTYLPDRPSENPLHLPIKYSLNRNVWHWKSGYGLSGSCCVYICREECLNIEKILLKSIGISCAYIWTQGIQAGNSDNCSVVMYRLTVSFVFHSFGCINVLILNCWKILHAN